MRIMTLAFIPLCISSLTANAEEWLRSSGESSFGLTQSWSTADSYWDKQRRLKNDNCTSSDWRTSVSYEYGYSYYHTLFGSTGFESNQCGSDSSTGIADIRIGIRGRLEPFRNRHAWELATIIPIKGSPTDKNKPGNGAFALEGGIYHSYLPGETVFFRDYETPVIWGWGINAKLWGSGLGQEIGTFIKWKFPFNDQWRVKARLSARAGFSSGNNNSSGITDTRKALDYDKEDFSLGMYTNIARQTSMGISVKQNLWGRNTSHDTALRLHYYKVWN